MSSILLFLAQLSFAQNQQFYLPNHPDLDHLNVRDVYLDDYSRMWIGTEDGVFRFDGNKVEAIDQRFAGDEGVIVPSGPIAKFQRLNERYLFVSYAPAGLALFDLQQDKYFTDPFSFYKYQSAQYPRGIYQLNQTQWMVVYNTDISVIDVTLKQEVTNFNIKNSYVADTASNGDQVYVLTHEFELIRFDIKDRQFTTTKLLLDYSVETSKVILNVDIHFYIFMNNEFYSLQEDNSLIFIDSFPICEFGQGNIPYPRKFSIYQQTNVLVNNCGIFSLITSSHNQHPIVSDLIRFTPKQQAGYKITNNFFGDKVFIKVDDILFYLGQDEKIYSQRENTKNVIGGFYSQQQFVDKKFNWVSNDDSQFTLSSDVISQFSGLTKTQLQRFVGTSKLRQSLFENEHTLWVGTQGSGLFKLVFNPESNQWTTQWNGLQGFQVRALYLDGDTLWIGTEQNGIHWFDLNQSFLHSLPVPELLKSAFNFVPLDDDTLLINTYHDGLLTVDKNTKTVLKHVPVIQLRSTELKLDGLRGLYRANNGDIWLATHQHNNKVIVLNPDFSLKQVYDQQNGLRHFMFDVLLDKNDTVWLATWGGGIGYKRKSEEQFHFLKRQDGLPSDTIYSLKIGVDGNLWVSTLNGLVKIENYLDSDPKRWRITNYYKTDGLSTQTFDSESHYQQADGTLVYGGYDGLLWFNPATDIKFNNLPPTDSFFTGLSVNGQNIALSTNENNGKTNVTSSRISLPYDAENIKLNFAAPSYILPAKNRYQYRTKQQNKMGNWIELQQPELSFASLVPGQYQLEVRGSNNDGVWAKPANFSLTIEPPWWQSKPAYIAYVLFVILTGITYAAWRNRVINQRNVQLEKLIEQRTEELNETLLAKQSMFENISHEFRTPLTVILGKAETLLKLVPSDRVKQELNVLGRQANRLYELVEQLLKLAELKAVNQGRKEYRVVFDVENIVNGLRSLADEKNISITLQNTCDARLAVELREDTLPLLLTNLLSNAIKYSPPHSEIVITLNFEYEQLKLSVRDQGKGFDDVSRVTKRFARETKDNNGFGLGLAIVKQIVAANDGVLAIDNIEEGGAQVSINLPCGKGIINQVSSQFNDDEFIISTKEDIEPEHPVDFPLSQILLVEDNLDLQAFISELLSPVCTLVCCDNGVKALMWLNDNTPDLILSDVMMPQMDGYELCRRVKNDSGLKHIPFVLLTAKSDLASQKIGFELKADDHIAKPFSSELLLVKLANKIRTFHAYRKRLLSIALNSSIAPSRKRNGADLLEVINIQLHQHMADISYSAKHLAAHLHMSEKTLNRRLQTLLATTFSQLLREFRIEQAHQLLLVGTRISAVTERCGFNSHAYFAKCFKDRYEKTPSEIFKVVPE